MEGNPSQGEEPLASRLPSLPRRPDEISPEPVSPLPHPGQAHPVEGSASLRVSPLTAVALSPSTTSSTNHHQTPADAERLASAPATDSGSSDSPSRAVPPTELPLGSTSTENGVCDAGSGIPFPMSAHISTDLPARSSVVTALPSLTQGLTTNLPPGGPSTGQPSHLAPDPSGASPNACEQMVPTPAPSLQPRDTTVHSWATHLPTHDQPPLDATINSNHQGARAVPTSQKVNLHPLRTCLPAQPLATPPDSAMRNVDVPREPAESLCGNIDATRDNAAPATAMASGDSMHCTLTRLVTRLVTSS